jgi:hypothetical protein
MRFWNNLNGVCDLFYIGTILKGYFDTYVINAKIGMFLGVALSVELRLSGYF